MTDDASPPPDVRAMSGDWLMSMTHELRVTDDLVFSIEGPVSPDELTRAAADRGEADPAYWAHIRPGAGAFALLLTTTPLITPTMRVLELGCGLGIAGIAASRRAATVMQTDAHPEAVRWAKRNARANARDNIEVAVYDWRADPDPTWAPDLVIASDVLYDPEAHEPICRVISALAVPALLADPNRLAADNIVETFERQGLRAWTTRIEGGRVFLVHPA